MKFDEYYRQYYGRIVAFARSYVNDEMVAQDIAADSMVKLWIHLKENPETDLHNWLFVIVKNLCLDYLKHQRIKQKAPAEVSLWKIQDLDFKISSHISKVLKVLKIALKDYIKVLILFVLLGFIIHR